MIAPWLSRRQTFRALTVSASDMSRKGVWREDEDVQKDGKKKSLGKPDLGRMSDLLGKWRSAKLPEVPGSGEVCEQVANSRLCSSLGVGGYCDRPRKVPEQEKEVLAPLASPAMPARACQPCSRLRRTAY